MKPVDPIFHSLVLKIETSLRVNFLARESAWKTACHSTKILLRNWPKNLLQIGACSETLNLPVIYSHLWHQFISSDNDLPSVSKVLCFIFWLFILWIFPVWWLLNSARNTWLVRNQHHEFSGHHAFWTKNGILTHLRLTFNISRYPEKAPWGSWSRAFQRYQNLVLSKFL